jgi:hypothetical protein
LQNLKKLAVELGAKMPVSIARSLLWHCRKPNEATDLGLVDDTEFK